MIHWKQNKSVLKKRKILLLFFCFISISYTQAQSFSKHSLTYKAGVGVSEGTRADGGGPVFSVGYQRNLWCDRFRLNLDLNMARYNAKHIQDAPDSWANSVSIQKVIYYLM